MTELYTYHSQLQHKATAIIELPDGVLVQAYLDQKYFELPNAIAPKGEMRTQTLMRMLKEQLGLRAHSILYLFDHLSKEHSHKVYLVMAQGAAKPQQLGHRIGVAASIEGELALLNETRAMLRRYLRLRSDESPKGEAVRAFLKLARFIAKMPSETEAEVETNTRTLSHDAQPVTCV